MRDTDASIRLANSVPDTASARRALADGAQIQRELWSLAGQALDAAPVARRRVSVEGTSTITSGGGSRLGGTLFAMNLMAESTDGQSQVDLDDPSGRLAAYIARTQTALDLLALGTLWIVVVPPGDFGSAHDASTIALIVRVCLSGIYGIDMTIRTILARRHWHYLRTHLLGVVVVAIPPLRVLLSLRLVRSLFRRGHLPRFMLAASVLVLNGAIIVYLFERHASGSNIHTLGQSVWWSVVTVTTVGYGDYYPVTAAGRVTASFIMGIGLLTLAVVTAQVSSSFVDQAARRRASVPTAEPATGEVTLAELAVRLARIEELLTRGSTEPR